MQAEGQVPDPQESVSSKDASREHERRVRDLEERQPEGAGPSRSLTRLTWGALLLVTLLGVFAVACAAWFFGGTAGLVVGILILVAYAAFGARPLLVAIFLRSKDDREAERQVSAAEHPPQTIRRDR